MINIIVMSSITLNIKLKSHHDSCYSWNYYFKNQILTKNQISTTPPYPPPPPKDITVIIIKTKENLKLNRRVNRRQRAMKASLLVKSVPTWASCTWFTFLPVASLLDTEMKVYLPRHFRISCRLYSFYL